jgi:hypothetical protein
MSTDDLIRNALSLLHERHDPEAAVTSLREAMELADAQGDDAAAGEVRVFLAEVLYERRSNLSEARSLLEAALRLASRSPQDPERIGPWRPTASELLFALEQEEDGR